MGLRRVCGDDPSTNARRVTGIHAAHIAPQLRSIAKGVEMSGGATPQLAVGALSPPRPGRLVSTFECPFCKAPIDVEEGGKFAYNRTRVLLHLTSCPEITHDDDRARLLDIADRIVGDGEHGDG